MEIKIGLLLPRSDMYPTLALDFMNGLRHSFNTFNSSDHTLKFLVEGVGTASDDGMVRLGEKMILQEDAALVVSFCSLFKLTDLVSPFNAYQKPLIHVNLGGNAIKKEHVSPNILYHSLNLWQSCYGAGMYAAKKFGKKGAIAASYYDGGYQHSQAFVQGFTDSGGEIVNYYVAPMDYKSENFEGMLQGIDESDPDVVFTLFSFNEGKKVLDVLAQSELNGKIPFVAIPTLTDESIMTENHDIKNMVSVASWTFQDEEEIMQNYISEIKETYHKPPTVMTLLGYEIGQVIAMTLNEHGHIPPAIANALEHKSVPSPRGLFTYNSYHETQIAQLKIRDFTFSDNGYKNIIVDTMDTSFMEDLYAKFEELPYAGWQNPYICT
ncbi:MAG: ABC transporter substrate-binding protein [Flavobacteriaceae bacterium]|nr:ABC transporter substrate-binding protein [Flavobacteriaceae bacterium]